MRGVDPYEDLHYPSKPFRYTRSDRMELVARLHGLSPAPAPTARVLEIGCGTGGNLLPMAQAFPEARFVGIDLAASQIAWGEAVRAEAGLDNAELRALDLVQIDDSFGQFDYVIAHGVFSWVPAPVRARLLDVIGERLAPAGVAFLSYDVKPGWYMKAAVRDLMHWHTADDAGDLEKVQRGRELLHFVARGARTTEIGWKALLEQQEQLVDAVPDAVVRFDQLSEVNEGIYFHELVAELPRRDLTYLCEASISAMSPDHIPPEALRAVDELGDDVVRREQILDFLGNRRFRCSLLVRAGAPISRQISVARLMNLHIDSPARPENGGADIDGPTPVTFKVPNASARVATVVTKRVLADLAARHPASRPFPEVLAQAGAARQQLAGDLFQLFSHDLVDFSPHPDNFVVEPSARPRAAPLARVLAARDAMVPSLRHESVELYPEERELLPLLDGTRDLAALQAALPAHDVPALLRLIGKKALFLG